MLTLHSLRVLSITGQTVPFVPASHLDFSWKLASDRTDVRQTSYRLILAEDLASGEHIVADTGAIASDASVHVPCPVLALCPRTAYVLHVEVSDNYGDTASASLRFATVPDGSDWRATWIRQPNALPNWAPYIRRKFRCEPSILRRATLYVAGLGYADCRLNGRPVSPDLLDPLSADYEARVPYRAYDILPLLATANAFTVLLGDGWYAQNIAWPYENPRFGDPCLFAEIQLDYNDGSRQIIATNASDGLWLSRPSPIVHNSLYGGETYDARLEIPDADCFDGSDEGWSHVTVDTVPKGPLVLATMPAVRIRRELPLKSLRPESGVRDGVWIYDFGENAAGIAELHLPPSVPGSRVILRFAETVHTDGPLDHRSGGAFATRTLQQDTYIARGDPAGEVWRPRFTYHGFRYVELSGVDSTAHGEGAPYEPGWLRVYALATDLPGAGSFHCADPDTESLQRVFLNTFLSNYHAHPEDCPVRERCGWLGDAQIVCNAGIHNFDLEASYAKYLGDIDTTRALAGHWSNISPGRRGRHWAPAVPLWGCAQILLPYWVYRHYANADVVRAHWTAMEEWCALQASIAEAHDGIVPDGYGDWCPPGMNKAPRRIPVAHSSTLMLREIALRMAELSHTFAPDREAHYTALANRTRDAFNRAFWRPDEHSYGYWASDAAALLLGMAPDGERDALVRALADRIHRDDFAMPTGIYGNKVLAEALARNGLADLLHPVLFHRGHASFATMLDQGATSLWETFEPRLFDSPTDHEICSYNHPMHGGFLFFLYECVAGLRPLEPGYRVFEVAPIPFGAYPEFDVVRETPYGTIRVSLHDGVYTLDVPPNAICRWVRPGSDPATLGSGHYTL